MRRMLHPYADIPEISLAGDSVGVIRIPVEQDVPFTPRVRAVVDTAEFQRLSHITQLALAARVYPGATHTRFEHALGVYHNALKYLWQLGRDPRFAEIVTQRDAEILIVAALLHDIGHWPFCHPIEDMNLPEMPPHEVFAREFLAPDGELTAVLLQTWGIAADEVLDLLTARSDSCRQRLMRSVLSGPVDIDKMDYLNRDSQHCGVPYGKHFDRHRLISSLILNAAGDGLAITTKGRTAAEMMVFARYVMFSEVYWHHAVRAATTMFARAFHDIHQSLDLTMLFRLPEPELIRQICRAAQDTPAEQLTNGLFGSHRRLHKRLAEYSVYHETDVYRVLRQCSCPQLIAFSRQLTQSLVAACGCSLTDTDILIDAPPRHREVEFHVDVYFARENRFRPLRDVSPIVNAMARNQFDDCVKRVRVFGSDAAVAAIGTNRGLIDEIVREQVQKMPVADPH